MCIISTLVMIKLQIVVTDYSLVLIVFLSFNN